MMASQGGYQNFFPMPGFQGFDMSMLNQFGQNYEQEEEGNEPDQYLSGDEFFSGLNEAGKTIFSALVIAIHLQNASKYTEFFKR